VIAAIPSPGLRKQVHNLLHLLDVSIVDKKNGHQPELNALVLEIRGLLHACLNRRALSFRRVDR
jgi:hypothetical protein